MPDKHNLAPDGEDYTITIMNDKAWFNHDGFQDMIHTWLVVTDNEGGPQKSPKHYAISYTASGTDFKTLQGKAYFEEFFKARLIGDDRITESLNH